MMVVEGSLIKGCIISAHLTKQPTPVSTCMHTRASKLEQVQTCSGRTYELLATVKRSAPPGVRPGEGDEPNRVALTSECPCFAPDLAGAARKGPAVLQYLLRFNLVILA
jgi:hypothetical protein